MIVNRKKILFLISKPGIGGAQTFLRQTLDHIDRTKFEVHTAASTNFFEIRKIIKNIQPDTLFLMSSVAGAVGTLVCRFSLFAFRPKVIFRIGGWSFNDPKPWWKPLTRYAEKLLARWRDVIIVNNKHDYDQAIRYGIRPREKLVLIHNGIDPFKMTLLSRTEARKKLGLPLDRFIAGTIARNDPTKGLEYLPKDVFVLSDVADASQYLLAFDVFVSSSLKEGFSWTLLEAMAAKVPVIATCIGAAPEMIEDGVSGFLVDPRDTSQIEDRISRLKNDERLRQKFALQAHQTVLRRFDLRRMIREIETLLLVP